MELCCIFWKIMHVVHQNEAGSHRKGKSILPFLVAIFQMEAKSNVAYPNDANSFSYFRNSILLILIHFFPDTLQTVLNQHRNERKNTEHRRQYECYVEF